MRPLVVDWRSVTDRGVPPMRVVPTLDPLEHRHLGFGLAVKATPVQQLPLQGGEEALGHRIVVSISYRSHRRHDTDFLAAFAEGVAGVLTTSIRVVDYRC